MTSQATGTPLRMGRQDYRQWSMVQPRGRFELVAGEVIEMAPARIAHVRVKAQVWRALDEAIRNTGLPCEALAGGITVEVGNDTDYGPDAVVNCGPRADGNEIAAADPVVIVEVLSPFTKSVDTGAKLAGYFSLPAVRHYLIVHPDRRSVIHHRRGDDGRIETAILAQGAIVLDPPGLSVLLDDFYAD